MAKAPKDTPSPLPADILKMSFEAALNELEEIVQKLESGDVDLEKSIEEGSEERDWSRAYENRYDDYFRTDFRIGVKLNGKRASQEWAIDLQNITGFQSIFMEL